MPMSFMKRNNIKKCLYIVAIFLAAMYVNIPVYSNSRSIPVSLPAGTLEGHLPNGLHYLILQNPSPVSRVEFRLVMRVGSGNRTAERMCSLPGTRGFRRNHSFPQTFAGRIPGISGHEVWARYQCFYRFRPYHLYVCCPYRPSKGRSCQSFLTDHA